MRIAKWFLTAMMVNLMMVCLATAAAESPMATSPADHSAQAPHADTSPCPKLSEDATWVRPMIVAIAALFLTAIPVGLVVRANMPQQVPATHAHDEPSASTSHGTSEHH
ncbi:MAG TPA: hypothetical protein VHP11_17595 [Tepidisphaeraceae bacterium]|nr:hypothetical protein [Tepidisphaeraceae bacterium]